MATSKTVEIKFLFSSKEGVSCVQTHEITDKISDVKTRLIDNWPEEKLEKVSEPRLLRFLCMGLGILKDDKTLSECKVPIFPTHPTPFNVSILPAHLLLKNGGSGGVNDSSSMKPGPSCGCILL